MWLGAKMTAARVSRMALLMIPLNRNSSDGRMERARARKTLLFRNQRIQIKQYRAARMASTIR